MDKFDRGRREAADAAARGGGDRGSDRGGREGGGSASADGNVGGYRKVRGPDGQMMSGAQMRNARNAEGTVDWKCVASRSLARPHVSDASSRFFVRSRRISSRHRRHPSVLRARALRPLPRVSTSDRSRRRPSAPRSDRRRRLVSSRLVSSRRVASPQGKVQQRHALLERDRVDALEEGQSRGHRQDGRGGEGVRRGAAREGGGGGMRRRGRRRGRRRSRRRRRGREEEEGRRRRRTRARDDHDDDEFDDFDGRLGRDGGPTAVRAQAGRPRAPEARAEGGGVRREER